MEREKREVKALQKAIAARIRKLRLEKGQSLEKLANITGLSKGYLSQIENCEKNPTISTLSRISFGLNEPINTLITGEKPEFNPSKFTIVRATERREIIPPAAPRGFTYKSLTYKKFNRSIDAYVITIKTELPENPRVHEGEEMMLALEGRFEFIYEGQSYIIEPGDSLYFDSDRPHNARSLDGRPAKILMVVPRHMG